MAAKGDTNAEIARRLLVSINLTRIYAKVGARSRTQLAAILAHGDDHSGRR